MTVDNEATGGSGESRVTVAEVMCVCLARELRGKQTALQGFASPLPTVAIRTAREFDSSLVHLSASGGMNPAPAVMPESTEDQRLVSGASAYFTSPEAFDLAARGKLDVLFIGSPQIDRYGNMNGSVIGPWNDPSVRFGGGGGSGSLLPLANEVFGWRTEHTSRSFPERVDFVTASGNLTYVVTPLCVFERVDGDLMVTQLHPGVTREAVQANTGWDVAFSDPVRTELPTDRELSVLQRVDPTNVREAGFSPADLREILQE